MKGSAAVKQDAKTDSWRDFHPGDWTSSINVRDFIVRNVTSYAGGRKIPGRAITADQGGVGQAAALLCR